MSIESLQLPSGYSVAIKDDRLVIVGPTAVTGDGNTRIFEEGVVKKYGDGLGVYIDLGVTMQDAEAQVNYDRKVFRSSQGVILKSYFTNFMISVKLSLVQIKMETLELLMHNASELKKLPGEKTLSVGDDLVKAQPRSMLISKQLKNGKTFSVEVYSAVNDGGIQLLFLPFDSEGVQEMEFAMIGSLDTERSDMDQLMKILEKEE